MALAKLFGKTSLRQIPTASGDAAFDPKIVESYAQLFKAVDNDSDGRIGGQEGALFLRRSRLDDDVLREVSVAMHAFRRRAITALFTVGLEMGLWWAERIPLRAQSVDCRLCNGRSCSKGFGSHTRCCC